MFNDLDIWHRNLIQGHYKPRTYREYLALIWARLNPHERKILKDGGPIKTYIVGLWRSMEKNFCHHVLLFNVLITLSHKTFKHMLRSLIINLNVILLFQPDTTGDNWIQDISIPTASTLVYENKYYFTSLVLCHYKLLCKAQVQSLRKGNIWYHWLCVGWKLGKKWRTLICSVDCFMKHTI